MNESRSLAIALVVLGLSAGCASAPRQEPVASREVGAFVVRLGQDTVSLEQYSRGPDRISGRQLLRVPRTVLREYEADLAEDGSIRQFRYTSRPADEAAPSVEATIRFGADSATATVVEGGATREYRVAARQGSIPLLGYSLALFEIPFVQLRRTEAERLEVDHVLIGGQQTFPLQISRIGDDSLLVDGFAGASRARVDSDGRLLGWDGRGSALALTADRTVAVDLDRLAPIYAGRDAAGTGLGVLSPRDTVTASVQDAQLTIEYSRPSRRSRTIFGNLVPWNEVWRTGADAATLLRTDSDLDVGGTTIPAGSYSLFTIPTETGWTLIVNRQTGQSGTEYDPAQDLARIPMQARTLTEPVEQFTISVSERGAASELILEWDDRRASVGIRRSGGGE